MENEEENKPIKEETNLLVKQKVKTPHALKITFEYSLARHLSFIGYPTNLHYLKIFVQNALAVKEIRENVLERLDDPTLKEFGFEKKKVINAFNAFSTIYYKNELLLKRLKEIEIKSVETSKRYKEDIYEIINELDLKLPVANDYIYLLFYLCIIGTDMEYISIPKESILHPEARFNDKSSKEIKGMKESGL